MGGHYGSVHVRSEDRERVKAVAEQIARDKQTRILVAPPVNGWIALFPENHGQDESVGGALAEQLDGDVLHLLVHDDDIFAYWYWRDRQLIDSYWSRPGYFGEEHRAREEAMAGNPEAFRSLIGDKAARLNDLLDRGDSATFASLRLEQFGKLLNIANAVNAFEYLKEGERTGIKNWRQFVEVPAESVEHEAAAKRQQRSRVSAERKRLQKAGILLVVGERKAQLPSGCAAGGGFLVAWPDYRSNHVSFNFHRLPWDQPPASPSLGSHDHSAAIASDASAQRIAFTAGKRVSVWDLNGGDWAHVRDVPEQDHAIGVALSADGNLVAHASREEVVVTRIDGGGRLIAWPTKAMGQSLALHPAGQWLAVGGNTLGLLALRPGEPWRDRYIGGKVHAPSLFGLIRRKAGQVNWNDVEKKEREALEGVMARIEKLAARSGKAGMSPEQIETVKRDVERKFKEFTSRSRAAMEGGIPPPPPQAREQVRCLGFSRDGRWLWCGTQGGLRVYEWSAVARDSGADMPPPRWRFQLPGVSLYEMGQQVYAIAEEVDAPAIVFGGGTGMLYRLDLSTGETREVMKLGENIAIYALALSADGKSLGAGTHTLPPPEAIPRRFEQRGAWSVWDYSKLRGPFLRPDG